MEKRTWIVWICVELSVKPDYDGWTIALKHLSINDPPGLVFSGLIWRVFHPGFHLTSHPHTISLSLSYPPTYTNSPAVFILVWAGLTSVKVKETQRSDRPDTADHHQPAANSNEQNNRHCKPGWEMAPLFNLLASLDTRLSVHDI